jgi:hypothetical protein
MDGATHTGGTMDEMTEQEKAGWAQYETEYAKAQRMEAQALFAKMSAHAAATKAKRAAQLKEGRRLVKAARAAKVAP